MKTNYYYSRNYKKLKLLLDDDNSVILVDKFNNLCWMTKETNIYHAYFKNVTEINIPIDCTEKEFIDVCKMIDFSYIN